MSNYLLTYTLRGLIFAWIKFNFFLAFRKINPREIFEKWLFGKINPREINFKNSSAMLEIVMLNERYDSDSDGEYVLDEERNALDAFMNQAPSNM